MAWPPLALRKSRSLLARRLASRTSALLSSSASLLDELRKRGALTTPLLLALRAANQLARTLAEQPAKTPSPAQRHALLSARARIEQLAAGILASGAAADPNTVEYELGQLIARTLSLIDQVTAEPPSIETHVVSPEPLLDEPDSDPKH